MKLTKSETTPQLLTRLPESLPGASMAEMSAEDRPRERLVREGATVLRSGELLGILLRTGFRGANAVMVGDELLRHFGSLEGLARSSLDELRQVKGVGTDKAATLLAALELVRRMSRERRPDAPEMDTPAKVADLLRDDALAWSTERMIVLLLNTRCRLIRMETISEGLLDQVLVHAREVFRPAIAAGAFSVVLVHNHPSGDPTPSEADIRVTRDLIRAGSLLRIEILDHIVLGRSTSNRPLDFCSMRELGYFHK